jgi:hypothetical protein
MAKEQSRNKVLMGAALAAMLKGMRMGNGMGQVFFDSFRGIYRPSSLRRRHQNASYGAIPGGGEQECYRRLNGGFYTERKHDIFR